MTDEERKRHICLVNNNTATELADQIIELQRELEDYRVSLANAQKKNNELNEENIKLRRREEELMGYLEKANDKTIQKAREGNTLFGKENEGLRQQAKQAELVTEGYEYHYADVSAENKYLKEKSEAAAKRIRHLENQLLGMYEGYGEYEDKIIIIKPSQ